MKHRDNEPGPAGHAHEDVIGQLGAVELPARPPTQALRLGIVGSTPDGAYLDKLDCTTLRPRDALTSLRGYRLLVIGEDHHTAHRLPQQGTVSVGRSDAADIRVSDPLMSRVHARLTIGGTLTITDLGSSNGTVVRGQRLAAKSTVTISVGDTIEVGSTVVIVQPEFSRSAAAEHDDPVEHTSSQDTTDDGPMERVYKLAKRIASSRINVLLLGETGVGKEVMARTIHSCSPRTSRPFLGLNCAALNEQLFESELFGYEKGAFTGAVGSKPGLIESADGGTVFLDEVGEMPLLTQAKLLRVLEERQVMRVGSLRPKDINVRFVAATNQDLEREIELGRFREDLFYRLNGISLVIPPLRERQMEIPTLARTFAAQACTDSGFEHEPVFTREALDWMDTHAWPGNIRELRNAVNRAVLLASGGIIQPEHLQSEAYKPRSGRGSGRSAPNERSTERSPEQSPQRSTAPDTKDGDGSERQRVIDALAACGGNQTRAAKMLGIARRTLTTRLDKLNIPRPRKDR